ncbi:MAG: hypothetical protein ACI84C_001190 [Flavobacteriales bacterium]|jgi:hypothetical protein
MKRHIKHTLYAASVLAFCLFSAAAEAQCNGGHTTDPTDMWLSCTGQPNPNEARNQEHWILYDLANLYAINESIIWNYNVPTETDQGIKSIVVDTSTNGSSWSEWGTFIVSEASGNETYEGEVGPDFDGIAMRYILISVVENWGDTDCNGFAEIKFNVGPGAVSIDEQEDPLIGFSVYPSPSSSLLTINMDEYRGGYAQVLNASGEVVLSKSVDGDRTTIGVGALAEGMYFIRVTDRDGMSAVQRFTVMR